VNPNPTGANKGSVLFNVEFGLAGGSASETTINFDGYSQRIGPRSGLVILHR
jgi:hypothetical protein